MIKRYKNKLVLINMLIFIAIIVFLFSFICIYIRNFQKSQLLSQLELSIAYTEAASGSTANNVGTSLPSIYSLCVITDKKEAVLYASDKSVSQPHIRILVHEATINGGDSGRISNDDLMFLKKNTKDGYIFAFASTDAMDEAVNSTIIISLTLGISLTLLFLVISDRLAHYTTKPIRRAWDSQLKFVNELSNDLRVPVSSIIDSNKALLLNKRDTIKNHQDIIDASYNNATKISDIVTQISDLTKSENSLSLSLASVNLSELTNNELLKYESYANDKRVSLCPSIKKEVVIRTNEEAYLRIASALLNEAIKYSRELEKIRISLDEDKKRAYLYVNTPTYIESDILVHLFERSSHTEEYSLGLEIAKNLAKALHGDLKVKSAPIVGTTFMLSIKKK